MIKLLIGSGCILFCSIFTIANQDRQTDEKKIEKTIPRDGFMKLKLKHSTNIVEGLATDDLEKIAKAAEGMLVLSQEADWNALTTTTYLKMSEEFRESARRLRKSADEKEPRWRDAGLLRSHIELRAMSQVRSQQAITPSVCEGWSRFAPRTVEIAVRLAARRLV